MQAFVNFVEAQFNYMIRCITSDNDLEFNMTKFYETKGIMHQRTCIETHKMVLNANINIS